MSGSHKKRNKNGLLTLDTAYDLSKAFKETQSCSKRKSQCSRSDTQPDRTNKKKRNRHGIKVLDTKADARAVLCELSEPDFETLLSQFLMKKPDMSTPEPEPMPVHKRIKRYPPVQKQLDLHGFTAVKAQVHARSFILNHRHQGFFTIRIIVGKGRHSEMGPVLPDVIEDLVADMKKQGHVFWFEWEKKNKTRSGALIVYLKQFD